MATNSQVEGRLTASGAAGGFDGFRQWIPYDLQLSQGAIFVCKGDRHKQFRLLHDHQAGQPDLHAKSGLLPQLGDAQAFFPVDRFAS
jgi:hypothetical protein